MAITYTWKTKALAQDEFGECNKAKWELTGVEDGSGKTASRGALTIFGTDEIKDKSAWTQAEIDAYAENIRASFDFDQEIADEIAAL